MAEAKSGEQRRGDKHYADLPKDRLEAIEAAVEEARSQPTARSKQSLLEEAYANSVAAQKAEADGDDDAAARFRENERICLEAADTAPDET